MLERALNVARYIEQPIPLAAFAVAFVGTALILATRSKKFRLAIVATVGIILVALAALFVQTLQSRDVYRVRVVVLGPDKLPINDAEVISSNGGEAKKVDGGWEFDIPTRSRPADGKLRLFASRKSAFLSGRSTLVLEKDYFPIVELQLSRDPSAEVRGAVKDGRGNPVVGALVSVVGYPGSEVVTDNMGNFVLPAHAADGQIVQVRAQKGAFVGTLSAPAGTSVEVVLKRP